MAGAQAILYLVAVVLLIVAAFRPQPASVSLVCLAGASALLAYSLPTLHGGL
jgi:hypothetical protein